MVTPRLRSVVPSDRAFMESVYFETQRWIVERLFGWRGDDVETAKFAEFYDEGNSQIIAVGDLDVGWLTIVRNDDAYELDGIYITAAYQRKGLGAALIRAYMEEAENAGLPIRLSTPRINPAIRLYRRLGFIELREDLFKIYMERKPPVL
jgi:GNAT superfamily N-acetyltransferase